MVEHTPGVEKVVSSIPWYGNIGLCALRQHIGLHAPSSTPVILPKGTEND